MATGQTPSFSAEVLISVPAEIYQWKAVSQDRDKAKEVQLRNRKVFLDAFDRDLAVLGYERDAKGNGKFLLGKWDETWSYATQADW